MGASVRIIRIIDDTYTVETEIECDDTKALMHELESTDWGRRIAAVLEGMLPKIEEKCTIYMAKEKYCESFHTSIEEKAIERVDIGESEEEEKEILIVWVNHPISDLPRKYEGYDVVYKHSPNYREGPTEYRDVDEVEGES